MLPFLKLNSLWSIFQPVPSGLSVREKKEPPADQPTKSPTKESDRPLTSQLKNEVQMPLKSAKTPTLNDSNSKEDFTPSGAKFSPKPKFVHSLLIRKRSVFRSDHHRVESTTQSDEKSHKSAGDQSLNSECIVTIQHKHGSGQKHQRRKMYTHHRQQNHHTTASFDSPPSDHPLDSIKSTDDFSILDQTSAEDNDQSNSFQLWPPSRSSEAMDSIVYRYNDNANENAHESKNRSSTPSFADLD